MPLVLGLGQHRTIHKRHFSEQQQPRKARITLLIDSREHTASSRQAGPVSQNQVCQRKHDIEFGLLLFESSVSCLSEAQLLLDDAEYVLHFCPDRRLRVLCFFGGVLSTLTQFLYL